MKTTTFNYKCNECNAIIWFSQLTITKNLEIGSESTCLFCGSKVDCYIDLKDIIDKSKKSTQQMGFKLKRSKKWKKKTR